MIEILIVTMPHYWHHIPPYPTTAKPNRTNASKMIFTDCGIGFKSFKLR